MSSAEHVEVAVGGGLRMPCFFARPDSSGPAPGVVVIHEVFGLNDDIRRIASRFADNGYATIAPHLHHSGPRLLCIARSMRAIRRREGAPLEDLDAARAWLAARDDVDGSRIGVVGFCMGGGFALVYAMRTPVGVVAPFYGDVPKRAEDLAGIAPVVGSFGGRDRVFAPQGRRLAEHLEALGVEHDVKIYPDAGHSFMSRHDPGGVMNAIGTYGPMRVGYDESAAEDAWTRMLSFFSAHLKG